MKRTTWLYIVDIIMALLTLLLVINTTMLWVVLPQGYFQSRLTWLWLHKWGGLALGVMVAIHLALHARWIGRMTVRLWRSRNARQQRAGPCPPTTTPDRQIPCRSATSKE